MKYLSIIAALLFLAVPANAASTYIQLGSHCAQSSPAKTGDQTTGFISDAAGDIGTCNAGTEYNFFYSTGIKTPAIQIAGTQTTVSCSTSGSAVFSQPEQGTSYKLVLIWLNACVGTASYTYPTAFTNTPSVIASADVASTIVTTKSASAVTVTGATTTGTTELIGY